MSGRETSWQAASLVLSLAGRWQLEREISGNISMEGGAVFSPHGDGALLYHEEVRLHLADGQELDGSRRYFFRQAGNGFDVLFDERVPRLFHHVELSAAGAELRGGAIHYCGADVYESIYDFKPGGSFRVRHMVSGPRKDYLIDTRYRR
ncbi:hypothetical protein GCM10007276_09750 [Agaricicola taiwanensis]|uniref:DUF6314 domain-containing protein n=1 Tax=Agaricicola taiwanensis TaxID=591372 RepID=A0A8J2YDL5_9RHOB|nr:DUF6314 family protein [Agaricicola taiwanensis]GGE34418.1 hypothetical protein GCM10007276_09750 [Agaricicola taiwanensis]